MIASENKKTTYYKKTINCDGGVEIAPQREESSDTAYCSEMSQADTKGECQTQEVKVVL